jgi:hypothetical protein
LRFVVRCVFRQIGFAAGLPSVAEMPGFDGDHTTGWPVHAARPAAKSAAAFA